LISMPADVRNNYVAKIFMRIGMVSTASVLDSDIIYELDAQGIPYELIQSEDNLPIS